MDDQFVDFQPADAGIANAEPADGEGADGERPERQGAERERFPRPPCPPPPHRPPLRARRPPASWRGPVGVRAGAVRAGTAGGVAPGVVPDLVDRCLGAMLPSPVRGRAHSPVLFPDARAHAIVHGQKALERAAPIFHHEAGDACALMSASASLASMSALTEIGLPR